MRKRAWITEPYKRDRIRILGLLLRVRNLPYVLKKILLVAKENIFIALIPLRKTLTHMVLSQLLFLKY